MQRSFTVHADRELAEQHRRALVKRFGVDRSAMYCEGARWSVAEILERFIDAEHQWRPATRSSHTSVVRFAEAKARVAGLDSLTGLASALERLQADSTVSADSGHRRKWDELVTIVGQHGSVERLLVADGARWWYDVTPSTDGGAPVHIDRRR